MISLRVANRVAILMGVSCLLPVLQMVAAEPEGPEVAAVDAEEEHAAGPAVWTAASAAADSARLERALASLQTEEQQLLPPPHSGQIDHYNHDHVPLHHHGAGVIASSYPLLEPSPQCSSSEIIAKSTDPTGN